MKKTIATFICTTSLVFSLSSTEHKGTWGTLESQKRTINTLNPLTTPLNKLNWDNSENSETLEKEIKNREEELFEKSFPAIYAGQYTEDLAIIYDNMTTAWSVLPGYARQYNLHLHPSLKAIISAYVATPKDRTFSLLENFKKSPVFTPERCNYSNSNVVRIMGVTLPKSKIEATIVYVSFLFRFDLSKEVFQLPRAMYTRFGLNMLKDPNQIIKIENKDIDSPYFKIDKNFCYHKKNNSFLDCFLTHNYRCKISFHSKIGHDACIFLNQRRLYLHQPEDSEWNFVGTGVKKKGIKPNSSDKGAIQLSMTYKHDPLNNNYVNRLYKIKENIECINTQNTKLSSKRLSIKSSKLEEFLSYINAQNLALDIPDNLSIPLSEKYNKLIFTKWRNTLKTKYFSDYPSLIDKTIEN